MRRAPREEVRATLIHNPNAGQAESEDTLVEALEAIGWEVAKCLEKKAFDQCLHHETDVIVVAGGDGLVSKVAKHVAGTDVPLAIVPMGTANNVARTLGIGVDAKVAVSGLERAKERLVDLGTITGDDGMSELFLEGFGMGVFAYVLGEKEQTAKKKKKLTKALALVADELETYYPQKYEVEVDGEDVSGAYLVVAVMNMRSFGPALGLAPDAQCDDGELDVVLVRPESREGLVIHLRRAAEEGDIALPAFEVVRGRNVVVRGPGRWAHVDDQPMQLRGRLSIDVAKGAVRVLVP